MLREGTCTARSCVRPRKAWVSVQKRDTGTIVVYPVCLRHVDAVWLWLGCDKVQRCSEAMHSESVGLDVDLVAYGLTRHLLDVGGRLGVPTSGDWSRLDVIEVQASPELLAAADGYADADPSVGWLPPI